jgi:hypothetical protein
MPISRSEIATYTTLHLDLIIFTWFIFTFQETPSAGFHSMLLGQEVTVGVAGQRADTEHESYVANVWLTDRNVVSRGALTNAVSHSPM